jgi:hypothetical protein
MKSILMMGLLATMPLLASEAVVDFEDLTLEPDSSWSGLYVLGGDDGFSWYNNTTGFNSGSVTFVNYSNGNYGVWGGFAYSNQTDTTDGNYLNQFSVYAGQAYSGSIFGVGYSDASSGYLTTASFDSQVRISGLYVTNTTYAALDMLNGSMFSKKFGGVSGNDPDWFMLTITGTDNNGNSAGSVNFYLADYRFEDNALDYVLDQWTWIDLSDLGFVSRLEFSLSSSDVGDWGMNTPAYFAIDNLTYIIPEPATLALLGLGIMGFSGKRRGKN